MAYVELCFVQLYDSEARLLCRDEEDISMETLGLLAPDARGHQNSEKRMKKAFL